MMVFTLVLTATLWVQTTGVAVSPVAGKWVRVTTADPIAGPAEDADFDLSDEGTTIVLTRGGQRGSFVVSDDAARPLRAQRKDRSIVLYRTRDVGLPNSRVTVTETILLTLQADGSLLKTVTAHDGHAATTRSVVLRREAK